MKIERLKASIQQKTILANWLELYAYDFTEFCGFDVDKKIAGFGLMKKGCPFSNNATVWDIAEFFILKKYRHLGVGTVIAQDTWRAFKGPWQVRVLAKNQSALSFWQQAIQQFTGILPEKTKGCIEEEDWVIYRFIS
jgi:predicted acetyltransferase